MNALVSHFKAGMGQQFKEFCVELEKILILLVLKFLVYKAV